MSELVVNFGTLNMLELNIDATIRQMNSRVNDLGSMAGRIQGVSTGRSYLGSAVSELYSRQNDIGDNIDKLTTFKNDLITFGDEAQQADQRVASRISYSTGSFCYTQGISMAEAAGNWWQSVLQEAADWFMSTPLGQGIQAVMDWYEANKDTIWAVVELVVEVAICVLAIAAFVSVLPASLTALAAMGFWGTVSMLAAGVTAAKSVADVISQTHAVGFHLAGDHTKGEDWSDRGLDFYMLTAGSGADDLLGTGDFFENCMGATYTGMEVITVVNSAHDVWKIGGSVLGDVGRGNVNFNTLRTYMGNDAIGVPDSSPKSIYDGYRYSINMGWSVFDSDPTTNPFTEAKFSAKWDDVTVKGPGIVSDISGALGYSQPPADNAA